ncbi:MAG: hypothetical protein WCI05_11355 [Myxococcales bacterium]
MKDPSYGAMDPVCAAMDTLYAAMDPVVGARVWQIGRGAASQACENWGTPTSTCSNGM